MSRRKRPREGVKTVSVDENTSRYNLCWVTGGKIYLTEAGINLDTPIHEYTHLWANAMMQRNPEGWQSIKDLLMGTTVWEQVKNDRNYTDIKDDENAVALLDHVRRALTKFWIWVGTDLFGTKL